MPRREVKAREYHHHGNTRWRVLIPEVLRNGGPGKRIFASKAKAAAFAAELNAGRSGWSGRLLSMSDEDQGRLVRALDAAGSIGALERAAELAARSRVTLTKPLSDAVKECVASKEAVGRSWQYVENLQVALGQFAAGRETRTVSSITSAEIDSWLNSSNWSASTRLTYIRRLETFFAWAAKRGYSASDPTAAVERPSDVSGPIVVLTPEECRRLLDACRQTDPGLLPYFAICLFAGIRPDETKRLRAENIRGDLIEVEAHKAKTRRRRLVEIHPTLRAWLDLSRDLNTLRSLEIGWMNWRRRWREVRAAAVVGERGPCRPIQWAPDILRHSFASYSYPIKGAAWTSNECGHSESVLFARYRALVTVEQAREFWAIVP
jgi:integrase